MSETSWYARCKVRVLCYLYHLLPCVIDHCHPVPCCATLLGAQQAANAAQRAAAAAAAAADSAEAAQNRAMRCREERELVGEILPECVVDLHTLSPTYTNYTDI